jgi:hypothetical protein
MSREFTKVAANIQACTQVHRSKFGSVTHSLTHAASEQLQLPITNFKGNCVKFSICNN